MCSPQEPADISSQAPSPRAKARSYFCQENKIKNNNKTRESSLSFRSLAHGSRFDQIQALQRILIRTSSPSPSGQPNTRITRAEALTVKPLSHRHSVTSSQPPQTKPQDNPKTLTHPRTTTTTMPSPPISPTSLSPSGKMASLASILHHGSTPITTQSTSSKSTPAPSSAFRQAASPPPPHHHHHSFGQQQRSQATSPPPGFGSNGHNNFITPLSPTTIASAGHRIAPVQEDLPFYHQLEQVQRVREGKYGAAAAAAGGATPSPLPPSGFSSSSGAGATPASAAAAAIAAYAYSTDASSGSKNGFFPSATFERQIAEVEEAKEVLRKAGVLNVGAAGGAPSAAAAAAWGSSGGSISQQRGSIAASAFRGSIASGGGHRGSEAHLKVQVQGDGNAMVRVMGSAEEADRDEGVRTM